MPETMKAAVYKNPQDIQVETVPYPQPGTGEVVVKVHCCGICGTDYHIVKGDFIAPYPLIGGHEFSGEIYELGDGVQDWQVGERVSADPSIFCGECYHCRNNQANHCKNWNAIGNTKNGAFAEFVKVPAKNLYRLNERISFEQGALIEPLSCVAHGLNRTQVKFGEKAVVFGGGPIGLLLVQALKTSGVSEVVLVDIAVEKLRYAEKFGATAYSNDENLIDNIGRDRYPNGFDIVIDATGIPAVIEQMFNFAGPRARILQFGVAPNDAEVRINPFEIYHKDWQYLGSMALAYNFYQAYQMIEQQQVDVDSLVTQKIGLEEFAAYMTAKKDAKDCKVLVYPGK